MVSKRPQETENFIGLMLKRTTYQVKCGANNFSVVLFDLFKHKLFSSDVQPYLSREERKGG